MHIDDYDIDLSKIPLLGGPDDQIINKTSDLETKLNQLGHSLKIVSIENNSIIPEHCCIYGDSECNIIQCSSLN